MRIDEGFRAAYRELEARMKALAEAESDVFLPNPAPVGPVEYVFVCIPIVRLFAHLLQATPTTMLGTLSLN
jgi:hypothetical protein